MQMNEIKGSIDTFTRAISIAPDNAEGLLL